MTNKLIKQLSDTFNQVEEFTPEKLQGLIRETLVTFTKLKNQINSDNPEEKMAGLKEAMELKTALEAQAKTMAETMDLGNLTELAEKLAKTKEDHGLLNTTKRELEAFKDEFSKLNGTQKKKKNIKTWLVG